MNVETSNPQPLAVKIYNLSIEQAILEFNMNYRANRYCKKS